MLSLKSSFWFLLTSTFQQSLALFAALASSNCRMPSSTFANSLRHEAVLAYVASCTIRLLETSLSRWPHFARENWRQHVVNSLLYSLQIVCQLINAPGSFMKTRLVRRLESVTKPCVVLPQDARGTERCSNHVQAW